MPRLARWVLFAVIVVGAVLGAGPLPCPPPGPCAISQ